MNWNSKLNILENVSFTLGGKKLNLQSLQATNERKIIKLLNFYYHETLVFLSRFQESKGKRMLQLQKG